MPQALLCKQLIAAGGEGNIPASSGRRHGSLASAGWVSSQVELEMVWEQAVAKLPHFPAINTRARCRRLLTHRTRCWVSQCSISASRALHFPRSKIAQGRKKVTRHRAAPADGGFCSPGCPRVFSPLSASHPEAQSCLSYQESDTDETLKASPRALISTEERDVKPKQQQQRFYCQQPREAHTAPARAQKGQGQGEGSPHVLRHHSHLPGMASPLPLLPLQLLSEPSCTFCQARLSC